MDSALSCEIYSRIIHDALYRERTEERSDCFDSRIGWMDHNVFCHVFQGAQRRIKRASTSRRSSVLLADHELSEYWREK